MKHTFLGAALLLSACATAPVDAPAAQAPEPEARAFACAPTGMDLNALEALKARQWVIEDEATRNMFARDFVPCLGHEDPAVRDGLAYEGLQHLMRNRQLSNETLAAIQYSLQANMAGADRHGFRSSFSALVLAEVVRTDRVQAWMTPEQRASALDAAVNYLTNLSDHRGFDEREGYRHAPAHAGDLMLQIVLNTNYGKPELTRVRDAIAAQIAPNQVFYITGESERLARPILFMAQRAVFSEEEWTAWFAQVAGPGPLGQWENWFRSNAGLARRHNLMMFFGVLQMNLSLSENAAFAPMRPGVAAAIRALP